MLNKSVYDNEYVLSLDYLSFRLQNKEKNNIIIFL